MARILLPIIGALLTVAFMAGIAGYRVMGEATQDLIPWGMMVAGYVFFALASGGVFDSMAFRMLSGERGISESEVKALAWGSIALLLPGIILVFADILHPEAFYYFYTSFQAESRIAWNAVLYLVYAAAAFLFLVHILRGGFNPESRRTRLLLAAGMIASLVLEANLGMAYGINIAVPAWYASMAPIVFVAASLVLGSAFTIVIARLYGFHGRLVESYSRELRYTLLVLVFIIGWSMVAMAGWGDAKETVGYMLARMPYAAFFWVGFIAVGVIVSFILSRRNPFASAITAILGAVVYLAIVFNFIPQYARLFTNPMYNLLASSRMEEIGLYHYLVSYEALAFIGGFGLWLLLQLYGLRIAEAILRTLGLYRTG